MKKFALPFTLFFSFLSISVYAENILTLTNPKTQETEVFRKGSFLVFELKDDKSIHEGFILDIADSSLIFDDAQVSLSQVDILAGSTKGKVIAGKVVNAIGDVLIVAGTTVFDCGLDFFIYGDGGYYYWPIGGSIWLAGAFITGLGYAFDWVSPMDHSVRVRKYRGWDAAIINTDQLPEQSESTKKNEDKIYQPTDSTQSTPPPVEKKSGKEKKKRKVVDDVYGE